MAIFTDVFEDVTKQGRKIPTSDYLETGLHPIIDQGQSAIAGYTDETEGLFTDVPAIIFGDHTRVLKYVDKPCFLGADGVKLLKAKIANPNYKYLYYVLSNANIPNTGYNRHFKWLKEVDIPLPNADEQQKIVETLDKISELIALRKEQLAKLDQLVKSRFIELFHEKNFPVFKWNDVFYTTTGKLDANAMVADGAYPFFTCAKEVYRIDKYAFDQEALLLAGNNAAGKYDVKYYKGKFNAYQRTYVLSLKQAWSYQLFRYQLEDKLTYLQEQSKGSNTRYITLKILGDLEFIIPPMELQNEFAAFVEHTDKLKLAIQASLVKLEILKKSLMQEYFG